MTIAGSLKQEEWVLNETFFFSSSSSFSSFFGPLFFYYCVIFIRFLPWTPQIFDTIASEASLSLLIGKQNQIKSAKTAKNLSNRN